LTLAVSESVQTFNFQGQVRQTQSGNAGNVQPTNTNVKIFYRTTNFMYPVKKLSQRNILFRYSDISQKFADFISNLFSKEQMLDSVYDLYFGTLHDPDMYVSHQFLSIIQGLETYHRRKTQDNDRKLRERLEEIVNKNFVTVADLIVEDNSKFIDDLVNTRNYLTHYNPKKKEKAAKDEDLVKLTGRAKLFLESSLLNELGFGIDEIKTIIQKNKHFDYLKK
jgi:hypothetical protein